MASGDETKSSQRGRLDRMTVALAGVAIAGWLIILVVNKWHIAAPVVFLCLGWVAVLLCGRTLWGSAQAAAGEGTGPDEEGFELSAGRIAELEKEKRSLLKAIKEVEFDREMGKMSEADAAEISRVYRARAIDILKELEGDDGAASARNLPIDRVIEGEVRARLALAGVASRAKEKAQARATARPAGTEAAAGVAVSSSPDAGASGSRVASSSAAGASSETGASSAGASSAGASSSAGGSAEADASSEAVVSVGAGAPVGEPGAGASESSAIRDASPADPPRSAAAAEDAGPDAGTAGAAPSASASTGAPSPKKKKSKTKAKTTRASDGSGGVAGSGSGGAGGAAMQKREDA